MIDGRVVALASPVVRSRLIAASLPRLSLPVSAGASAASPQRANSRASETFNIQNRHFIRHYVFSSATSGPRNGS
jgi:hypothetical protein